MANAREIQGRMKSIKDTMKITNAMYMVSSSKLQKARRDLKNTEPFFFMMQDGLAKILDVSPDAGTEFFDTRPQREGSERRKGYLVITADKGLAGAYNHNIIKITEQSAAMTLTAPIQGLAIGALCGLSRAAGVIAGKRLGGEDYDGAYRAAKRLMVYGAVGASVLCAARCRAT